MAVHYVRDEAKKCEAAGLARHKMHPIRNFSFVTGVQFVLYLR